MDILLSFFAGLISSACFYILLRNLKINRYKEVLKEVDDAKYIHYELNGEPSRGNWSTVKFEKPNKLHFITCSPMGHDWEGKITMNEMTPRIGAGYFEYFYQNKESWGTMRIHIKENNDILVHSVHKEMEEEKVASYIMKKASKENPNT